MSRTGKHGWQFVESRFYRGAACASSASSDPGMEQRDDVSHLIHGGYSPGASHPARTATTASGWQEHTSCPRVRADRGRHNVSRLNRESAGSTSNSTVCRGQFDQDRHGEERSTIRRQERRQMRHRRGQEGLERGGVHRRGEVGAATPRSAPPQVLSRPNRPPRLRRWNPAGC